MPKSSSNNLPEVLSYALLGGTSIYCLMQLKDHSFFPPHVTYGVMTINGIFGFLGSLGRSGNSQIEEITGLVQTLFALPCINTPVWLAYGYQREPCWAWCLVPIIPLVFYLADANGLPEQFVEIMIIVNIIGLGGLCLMKENWEGVGAACAYTAAYCFAGETVFYNIALSVFGYLALLTLGYGN